MNKQSVTVYTSTFCPYCQMAKRLLKQKGVSFRELKVDFNNRLRDEMEQRSGRYTVPQIFVGRHHVGGYDDMALLDRKGQLDPLLGAYRT